MPEEKIIDCPACNRKLSKLKVQDIVVDICEDGCGGVWFDAGELKKVDEKHENAGEILLNLKKSPEVEVDFSKTRTCPVCQDIKLYRHYSSVKMQIEVDECQKCGGFWLDAGELEKIRNEYENQAAKEADAAAYFANYSANLIDHAFEEDYKRNKPAGFVDSILSIFFGTVK